MIVTAASCYWWFREAMIVTAAVIGGSGRQ